MPFEIKSTSDIKSKYANILVFGDAKVGKTKLAETIEKPLIIDIERGLLSISNTDIPYITVGSISEINNVIVAIAKNQIKTDYDTIVFDSLSEVAEVKLADMMRETNNDARRAYPETQRYILSLVRTLKHVNKDKYYIARQTYDKDDERLMCYMSSFPGKGLIKDIPYEFDSVMAMRIMKDSDGNDVRVLQCQPDDKWRVGDRSGKLDKFEKPHLGDIINKIKGVQNEN